MTESIFVSYKLSADHFISSLQIRDQLRDG